LAVGALIGAVCGGLAGRALDRTFSADPQRRRYLTIGTLLLPAVVVLAGVLFETVRTRDELLPSGGAAKLHYEIGLPPGTPVPRNDAVFLELRTEKEVRKPPYASVHADPVGDRIVLKSYFETSRTAKGRTIRLKLGDGPTYVFALKLMPPRPPAGYARDFHEWHGPDHVEETGKPSRPPQPNENLQIRYKMDMI
jgi:hypothetical protein